MTHAKTPSREGLRNGDRQNVGEMGLGLTELRGRAHGVVQEGGCSVCDRPDSRSLKASASITASRASLVDSSCSRMSRRSTWANCSA